jgi:hypothetical protein
LIGPGNEGDPLGLGIHAFLDLSLDCIR